MNEEEFIQIDSAARGMVSGPLAEWPVLKKSLENNGIYLPTSTDALGLQTVCAMLLLNERYKNALEIFATNELSDDNCASIEIAKKRIRKIASDVLNSLKN